MKVILRWRGERDRWREGEVRLDVLPEVGEPVMAEGRVFRVQERFHHPFGDAAQQGQPFVPYVEITLER